MAYMNPLGLYSLLLKRTLHFMQRRCRITMSLRAAIEDNYFHTYFSDLMTAFTSVIMSLCVSSGSESFEVSVTLPACLSSHDMLRKRRLACSSAAVSRVLPFKS